MTTTPLATIADALIEFILSLLRDPRAAAEFETDPDKALSRVGLTDVCAADVRSVLPVIVDHPDVVAKPAPVQPLVVVKPSPGHVEPRDPEVVKHITSVANNYQVDNHIDNRSTIVDQSVNQNIWAEGDVMQIFDQEAVIATGDNAVAAGGNAVFDESDTDITIGDVSIGNEDTNITVNDSFNDQSTDVDSDVATDIDDSYNDESSSTSTDVDVDDSFNDATTIDVESYVSVESDTDSVSSGAVEADLEPLPEFDENS